MEKHQYAFLSERGDYDFNFSNKNISSHFIVVAVIANKENKDQLENRLSKISFEELTLNQDLQDPVEQLKDLPFTIYAYVIDKRKISEDSGIRYKKTFFERIKRMIFEDLSSTFSILDMAIDEGSNNEFLHAFKAFVNDRSMPDLFNYFSFGFNETASKPLFALANFIADELNKSYAIEKKSPEYPSSIEQLKEKIIRIHYWPVEYRGFIYDQLSERENFKYDELVLQHAIRLALVYIQENRNKDNLEEKDRVDFLNFLLYKLHENPNQYVYTEEILENLNAIRVSPIGTHYLRSNVVSYLRDQGVLIASSAKGYKLPVCLEDIYDFVHIANITIQPLLNRIAKAREQILLASDHEIDILDRPEFTKLKRFIEIDQKIKM